MKEILKKTNIGKLYNKDYLIVSTGLLATQP